MVNKKKQIDMHEVINLLKLFYTSSKEEQLKVIRGFEMEYGRPCPVCGKW
jgi:hypothetical protein